VHKEETAISSDEPAEVTALKNASSSQIREEKMDFSNP